MNENNKNFDEWNEKKQELDTNTKSLFFKEGEIWWCSVGINIGEETYGKGKNFRRPVIILKKLSHTACIVLPSTTRKKDGSWFYHLDINQITRWVMMHQIRFISAYRLSSRESVIPTNEFRTLKKSVAILLGFL